MNGRIFKLATKARQHAWVNETHWSANAEREALFEEKFAELMIEEFQNILSNNSGEDTGTLSYRVEDHFRS